MNQKLSYIFILFLLLPGWSLAQDKKIDIRQAAIGRYTSLAPESLSALEWRKNTHQYSYVKDYTNIFVGEINSETDKKILQLKELNEKLTQLEIEPMSYLADFIWVDKNTLKLEHKNFITLYDIEKNEIAKLLKLDKKAENVDFCAHNTSAAFTIDNNLYLADGESKISQITDSPEHFINGQSVSRREFGIEKGTFWSPKGNFLAFYRKDVSNVTDYPLVNITTRIATLENDKYPMAGMKSEHIALGVYDLKTGKTLYIEEDTISEKYLTNIAWSPDEKYIYIAVLNRGQNHMKMNKYEVSTGKLVNTLFEEKHDKYVEPLHPPLFLNNNPDEFIWQSRRDGFNHLYLYNSSGKLIKQLTQGEWEVTEILGTDQKADNLFYMSTEPSPIEQHAYSLNLKNGKTRKLTKNIGTHECSISFDGQYLLDTYSSTEKPNASFIISEKGKLIKTLVDAENPLAEYNMPEMEIFKMKAADNSTDLYCRLIKPADFDPDKKYPAIVYVYGGPHAQLVTESWLGGASMWAIYMAQNGYVMLTVDNRGSANRGSDFENVIHRQLGQLEMKDQMKGIDYLKNLGYVDMDRIGVHGWSYGGFMTISLMLNYPEIIKAGVAGGPVTDWKYYEVMYGERYMDTPQENPEGYEKTSLLNKIGNLDGRLLIIHGGIDNVVVWQHSLDLLHQSVKKDVLIDYYVYPRHEHNVRGIDRVHLIKKITQYFEDFL